jgi:hypothetical protein
VEEGPKTSYFPLQTGPRAQLVVRVWTDAIRCDQRGKILKPSDANKMGQRECEITRVTRWVVMRCNLGHKWCITCYMGLQGLHVYTIELHNIDKKRS